MDHILTFTHIYIYIIHNVYHTNIASKAYTRPNVTVQTLQGQCLVWLFELDPVTDKPFT